MLLKALGFDFLDGFQSQFLDSLEVSFDGSVFLFRFRQDSISLKKMLRFSNKSALFYCFESRAVKLFLSYSSQARFACSWQSNQNGRVVKWVFCRLFDLPFIVTFEFSTVKVFHMLPESRESRDDAALLFDDHLRVAVKVCEVSSEQSERHSQTTVIVSFNNDAVDVLWLLAGFLEGFSMNFKTVFELSAEDAAFEQVLSGGLDSIIGLASFTFNSLIKKFMFSFIIAE